MKAITLNELKEQLAVAGHDTICVEVNKDTPKGLIKSLAELLSSTRARPWDITPNTIKGTEHYLSQGYTVLYSFMYGDYTYCSRTYFESHDYNVSNTVTIIEEPTYVDLSLAEFKEVFENRESQLWVLMDDSTDQVVLEELAKMYYKTCLIPEVDSGLFIRNTQDTPGVPYYLHLSAYPGGSGFSKAAYYASRVHPIRTVYRIHKDTAMHTDREKLQHLLDGGTLINRSGKVHLAKKLDASGKLIWADGAVIPKVEVIDLEDSIIYNEPKWYDNIPDQGDMCWVSDENREPTKAHSPRLIIQKGALKGFYAVHNVFWEFATPLTVDEMVAYTYIPK